jgi:hypothetical protein
MRRLGPERRTVLGILADAPHGLPEATLLAHDGFDSSRTLRAGCDMIKLFNARMVLPAAIVRTWWFGFEVQSAKLRAASRLTRN